MSTNSNKQKNFLTFTNDDGSESVYELLDEIKVDGSTYIAIAPTEYYVLKKIGEGGKEVSYAPVEGAELDKVCPVFDARINVIDHDKK